MSTSVSASAPRLSLTSACSANETMKVVRVGRIAQVAVERGGGRRASARDDVREGFRQPRRLGLPRGRVFTGAPLVLGHGQHPLPALAEILVGGARGVEARDPLGQLREVVAARNHLAGEGAVPVGGAGRAPRRENGAAVFARNADHLRAPGGHEAQLVAQGRGEQVARAGGHLGRAAAEQPHAGVADVEDGLLRRAVVPVVADDAGLGGPRAREHRGVAGRGLGRDVVVVGVRPRRALALEAFESARDEQVVEAFEEVVTELIDGDEQHEARSLVRGGARRRRARAAALRVRRARARRLPPFAPLAEARALRECRGRGPGARRRARGRTRRRASARAWCATLFSCGMTRPGFSS